MHTKYPAKIITLEEVSSCQCIIGLSYFDNNDKLLKQSTLAGEVIAVSEKSGISLKLADSNNVSDAVFVIPSNLSCWFKAPAGEYQVSDDKIKVLDPDYLITWDVYQVKSETPEGQHQWWEWVARTALPVIGEDDSATQRLPV